MRIIARFVIGVAVVLILAGAGLYLMRKPIVEAAVERVMARMGLENPDAALADVSLSRLSLERVAAGADCAAPDLALEGVALDYEWRDLIFRARTKSVRIAGGAAIAAMTEEGLIDIAGWSPDPNAKRAPPPFKTLRVDKLALIARTPKGDAAFDIAGAFDYSDGGQFDIVMRADNAGFEAVSIADAAGRTALDLGRDGSIRAKGSASGAISTPMGVAQGVDVDLEAALSSWRGIFGEGPGALEGEATVALKSSTVDASATPQLAAIAAGGATPIRTLTLSGTLKATFAGDGVAVTLTGSPLTIAADRGDLLTIGATEGPLFEDRRGARRFAFKAALEGPAAKGEASLEGSSHGGGPWRVKAAAALGEQTLAGLSIGSFSGSFEGDFASDRLDGEAEISTLVRKAEIGRLRINDMPAAGRFALAVDADARTLTATPSGEACLDFDRATLQIAEQDTDARAVEVRLCPTAAPLIVVGWGDEAKTRIEGALDAASARYRVGRTEFEGAPPRVEFALDYEPAAQTTRVAGEIKGGRVILNKAFILSEADGTFGGSIVGTAMSARAVLVAMKIAQNAETEMVAPVKVEGDASLAEDVARFDFAVMTPRGALLGKGEGSHAVKTGRGEATFDSGVLTFASGLQPDRLIPALKGVISNASGTAEGEARFAWTPGDISSSATVHLGDVSFAGPGVAVTRTEGVAGTIALSNLAPVATDGEQTLSIRKIDMDALKIENGGMRFSMPGDGTLNVIEAEFPWFGGTIGAYNSQMSIASAKAETTLQIDNVDLSELLGFINVEGLSGVGTVEGVLPIVFEGGKARVNKGVLSSKGSGVVRYQGKAGSAAAQSNEQSALAFEILRELRFEKLSAVIDGPLDGTLNFNILFEGRSDIPVQTGGKTQRVDSPVKYRVTVSAPLLSLIEQAALSTNFKLQIERAKKEQAAEETTE
ncbi:MAG: intermembrane phospholipid transport protein YdbH family protein [Pseudomonadota bacterium]